MVSERRSPTSVVTVRSDEGFASTVTRLRDALVGHGMTVFAEIDQAAAAAAVGLTLRPTVLFVFGNPHGGTPVMRANPLAGLLLPLRAQVWEDDDGATYVAIEDVSEMLTDGFGLDPALVAPLAMAVTVVGNAVRQQH